MKVKFKDLDLALEYVKNNGQPESIEIDESVQGGAACEISFVDKNNKPTKITIFASHYNVTPEVRVTTKLYRAPIGLKQETQSVDD